ncbi:hypothetical protein [Gordonia sp. (in: high G+C Gram-positive bacteria)]|uniref:hypothetical protein n=1 Tax=Gordonia sp. (in: high G+C Gram-positive bacteria) TaxID=84139 RepID=UPI003C751DFF
MGVVLASVTLLSGCGSDDAAAGPQVKTLGEACDVLGPSIAEFTRQAVRWQLPSAPSADGPIIPFDTYVKMVDDADPDQRRAKDLAVQINRLTPEMKAAIDNGNDAAARKVVDSARKLEDEFIAVCSTDATWTGKNALVSIRKQLDEQPLTGTPVLAPPS